MTYANREIINEELINENLNVKFDEKRIDDILQKALELKGLTLEETGALLNVEDSDALNEIFHTAKEIKEKIYGKRIVLFAPLYASNFCSNNCVYCAFRRDNCQIKRVHLSPDEVVQEAKAIMRLGHKRIILLTGEDYKLAGLDYIEEIIDKIYKEKVFNGEIRRININIAPLSVENFKRLSSFGLGTYQLFQETYHRETYKVMHPAGKKADYDWRITAMNRAIEGGIKDFGIGPLFGLADYKFETLATLMHSQYLDREFGVGPHTISVPRIEPAQGVKFTPKPMSDTEFKKIVAVLRLAVPYTGLVLSTRETPQLRRELLDLGVSQISAESKVNPGGYEVYKSSSEQFTMADNRCVDEVVYELVENGYIPSFCTACYRKGRVGKDFMDLAKTGVINKYCQPNALTTFMEYLEDYASEKTKLVGAELVKDQLKHIDSEFLRNKLQAQLDEIHNGKRDLYI